MATDPQFNENQPSTPKSPKPKAPPTKSRSSLNALKLGLYCQAALMPGEDPKPLAQLNRDLVAQYQPKSPGEKSAIDEIAAIKWRILRCSKIESGLFHLYRQLEGKVGTEAQAFANDLKNLAAMTKLPGVETSHERKLDRALKRLSDLRSS
jgi:hypothetical protein